MVAGSRIGLALGGLFLLDQPCRWSHHQRLPRFFLGAAAYDRRVGPLDRDLGEPDNGKNPIVGTATTPFEVLGFVAESTRAR